MKRFISQEQKFKINIIFVALKSGTYTRALMEINRTAAVLIIKGFHMLKCPTPSHSRSHHYIVSAHRHTTD